MLDLVLRDGLVFDGLGNPPGRRDVGVEDGRVAVIAHHIRQDAARVVDASGLWVLPGFVDIHTHYDVEVEIAPRLSESVRHGVTSVVMGNCSLSLTLGDPQTLADIFLRVENIPPVLVRKWLDGAVRWGSPAEYFRHLRELDLGPNVSALLGHSALRAWAMGLERSLSGEPATEDDLARMEDAAVEAFEAGCLGLSVDMVPWHMMSGRLKGRAIPSHHAGYAEVARLAELCRERDLVFQVTPDPQRPLSMAEILWLCHGVRRPALRATVLSAIDSVAMRPLRHFFPLSLFAVNRLCGGNLRYQTLAEPFTVYSDGPVTPLFEEFPTGVRLNDGETSACRARLWTDPAFRDDFRREWTTGARRTFHRDLAAMRVVRCPDRSLEGRSFAEAAVLLEKPPVEAFMDLLAAYDTDLRWVSTGANDREGPRLSLLRHPGVLPGFTDAGAHVRNLGYYDGPLSLLKQAVRTGFMTPERAVHRSTGEAAAWFRLDAGVLAEGRRADLVVLDPLLLGAPLAEQVEVRDPLLDGAPRMVKRGNDELVREVYVAGRLAWAGGEPAPGPGAGSVLTPEPSPAALLRRERARIDARTADHPFTRYWDVFVLKHQDPRNLALHCLGVVLWYGLAAAAVSTRDWRWLLALPSSQLVGLVGHWLFERSHIDRQDAFFSLRASACLNKMFLRVVTGRYAGDVRRLRERLASYQARRAATRLPDGSRHEVTA